MGAIAFETYVKPGMKGEKETVVTEQYTARVWGSGGLPVYATPAMIGLMEGASVAAVDSNLPAGFSTVGTLLNVSHIAATPLGMTVRASGELLQIEGRRLVFKVEAFDEVEKIGEGTHERYIIENEKFLKKAEAKKH
ncbi:MAG: thioesterase family protein [Treponema sp.]|jgi:predicted thioesterase|nr:thioesterase family protein [Treponema sp.]